MKIIFDNETERDLVMEGKCPRDINPDAVELSDCGDYSEYPCKCPECWEHCGIELEVKNNSMKTYKITLEGCDDQTDFEMELTSKEYELVKRISEKANETSTYGCMPRMYITEVNPDESDNQD